MIRRKLHVFFFVFLFLLIFSVPSFAYNEPIPIEPASDRHELKGEIPEVPPPYFARYKHRLPDLLIREKREKKYITPVPMVGVDPDTGFNFGIGGSYFNDGTRDDPFFTITPYRERLDVYVVASTKKLFQASLFYDQPYVLDTPWRIRLGADALYNPTKNYFGIANSANTLTYPGSTNVYGNYNDYRNDLKQTVNGQTWAKYDEYSYSRADIRGSAEYDLLGGYLRPLAGFQVSRVWVGDYTGDSISGAIEQPTHLNIDCASGRAIGCNGGFDNYVKFGITFDTRDFEPDPTTGVMYQLTTELSPKFLGSKYNYGRLTNSLRAFGNVFRYKKQDLVLAGRFMYQWQFGDIPFYSMNNFALTDDDKTGLGGIKTMRGYKLDRFIGPAAMLTNVEARWSFCEFKVFNQYIKLMAVPFVDAGSAFEGASYTSFKNWKVAGGGGLHLAWNLATIVSLDYGFSSEWSAFYMDLSHQF